MLQMAIRRVKIIQDHQHLQCPRSDYPQLWITFEKLPQVFLANDLVVILKYSHLRPICNLRLHLYQGFGKSDGQAAHRCPDRQRFVLGQSLMRNLPSKDLAEQGRDLHDGT